MNTASLVLFGQVWSFLKFHHRAFTDGDICPERAFLDLLPQVAQLQDAASTSAFLGGWVKQLDTFVPEGISRKHGLPKRLHPRLSWIATLGASHPELASTLLRIFHDRSGYQQAVTRSSWGGNVAFPEDPVPITDRGWVALGVCRYWGAVEYFSPYRHLMDDWTLQLERVLPQACAAPDSNEALVELLQTLFRATHDGHAALFDESGIMLPRLDGDRLPFGLRYCEGGFYVSGSAVITVKVGDRVLAIDDQPLEDAFASFQPRHGVSRADVKARAFCLAMQIGAKRETHLLLKRDDRQMQVMVARAPHMNRWVWPVRRGAAVQELGRVAYIQLVFGAREDIADFCNRGWRGFSSMILDLRGYPAHGFDEIVPRFARRGIPFARGAFVELHTPGKIRSTGPISKKPSDEPIDLPCRVLIDEGSMSHAEYFAMALAPNPNVLLFGSETAGADGNRSFVPMPNGWKACFSGYGVTFPDGTQTQNIGIMPDRKVRWQPGDLRQGMDPVIAAAMTDLATMTSPETNAG